MSIMLSEATFVETPDSTGVATTTMSTTTTTTTPAGYEVLTMTLNSTLPMTAAGDAEGIIEKTMLVTMLSGIVLLIMSLLKLSKVVVFIPMSCISGFTTGAAFHIVTSQVKFILGVKIQPHVGIFKFVKIWREIVLQVPNTNVPDLVVFLVCFVFLVIIKELVNPKLRKKLPVPIPGDLIVVIVACVVSYTVNLNKKYDIRIVNDVPAGFRPPSVPGFDGFAEYIGDAIIIAIICFAMSYAMVATFATKHKYEIDAAQETLAYAMIYIVGSVFGSFAGATAPPRCTILDTTGAKTQLVHLFSCIVLLLVILVLGPLFEPLPNSCLAAIIVVALFPLFKQVMQLKPFWKVNKFDFTIWLVTWSTVVFLDISFGLGIGVVCSIFTLAVQACYSSGQVLTAVGHLDIHQTSKKHEHSAELRGVKVFKFQSSLHFASLARFKEQLFTLTANPQKIRKMKAKQQKLLEKEESKKSRLISNGSDQRGSKTSEVYLAANGHADPDMGLLLDLHTIVVDCSSITYIDFMGLRLLGQLKADYNHVGVNFVLANCSDQLLRKLKAADILAFEENGTFPTVQDAVVFGAEKMFLTTASDA